MTTLTPEVITRAASLLGEALALITGAAVPAPAPVDGPPPPPEPDEREWSPTGDVYARPKWPWLDWFRAQHATEMAPYGIRPPRYVVVEWAPPDNPSAETDACWRMNYSAGGPIGVGSHGGRAFTVYRVGGMWRFGQQLPDTIASNQKSPYDLAQQIKGRWNRIKADLDANGATSMNVEFLGLDSYDAASA